MKKISLEELLKESGSKRYKEQYEYVIGQIDKRRIRPVKTSSLNGKKPALHVSYWVLKEEADYSAQIEELQFEMSPAIQTDYYLKHLDVYADEVKWVRLLNRYFLEQGEEEPELVSLNERSFQIWGREKFLQREHGKKVLAHCGIGLEKLRIYRTTEPLAYYSISRQAPQTIVIVENKDTFYSMRRFLMQGKRKIFGEEVGTVIYGAGKGILRSAEDFRFCVEPYIRNGKNRLLYFGDLDYEGVGIYELLARMFGNMGSGGQELEGDKPLTEPEKWLAEQGPGMAGEMPLPEVEPFVQAYEKMIQKMEQSGFGFIPTSSVNQNQNLTGHFFGFFSEEMKQKMNGVLQIGKYIPQEIVNIGDF